MAELVRELNAFQTTAPVTDDEMERTIAGSTRELPGQFETAGAVLTSLINSARYGRPLDYAATLTERYEALSLDDLRVAADDVIQPEALTWLVVGDLREIRSQVEATGIAPVEVWTVDGERVE
jgi:zinc protease